MLVQYFKTMISDWQCKDPTTCLQHFLKNNCIIFIHDFSLKKKSIVYAFRNYISGGNVLSNKGFPWIEEHKWVPEETVNPPRTPRIPCLCVSQDVWPWWSQEYWSGLPFPSPGDLPNPGIEPRSPALQADALPSEPPGKPLMISMKFKYVGSRVFRAPS